MPKLTEYRLTFHAGFHLGTRGVGLEESALHLPADTLFAALVDAHRRAGGDPDAFVAPFPRLPLDGAPVEGEPPFRLTSAFPFAGRVRFFPMPVPLPRWFDQTTLRDRRKALKRIRFVSEALFRRMAAGEPMDAWLFPADARTPPKQGVALQSGHFWLTREEVADLPPALWTHPQTGEPLPLQALQGRRVLTQARVPHVTVDRLTSASEVFHAGRVSFAPGCGLWFGVAWQRPEEAIAEGEPTYREAFRRALAILADDGLGGERSTGYGAFRCAEGEETLTLPDAGPDGLLCLLSRYHPRRTELPQVLTGAGTAYELTAVGGWLRSWDTVAQRRRRLWLLAEGSVVRAGASGDLVDVRPLYPESNDRFPHPVWRYGLALGAGLKEVDRG